MENGKWKMENNESESNRDRFSDFRFSTSLQTICSACGAETPRDSAKFCRICGKLLLEDYQPLDTLRASYRMQGKSFQFEEKEEITDLFEENKNSASSTASAFVVYSLVPYLGILFCPGAFVMGSIGAVVSYRNPSIGGARTSIYSIVLSLVIFAIQILLWWLLYIVPELGK
jgi:ribosomal protein L40E